jgi:photosystem II stability/assembly factor-like uncharacterized protein
MLERQTRVKGTMRRGAGMVAIVLIAAGCAGGSRGVTPDSAAGRASETVAPKVIRVAPVLPQNRRIPQPLALPTGFSVGAISFIDANDGWVLGTRRCQTAACLAVLGTTDGGRSWTTLSAPAAAPEYLVEGGLRRLTFIDDTVGYAYGSDQLWQTVDSGRRWTRVWNIAGLRRYYLYGVTAGNHSVLTVFSTGDANGPTGGLRVATAAPGAAFRLIKDFGDGTYLDGAGAGDVFLVDAHGALSAVSDTQVQRIGRLPEQDCGTTGVSIQLLFAVCGQSAMQGSFGARTLYRSNDGGRTWSKLADPGRGAGYLDGELGPTAGQHDVLLTGSGEEASILTTDDGARRWHATFSVSDGVGDLFVQPMLFDDGRGYVVYAAWAHPDAQDRRYGARDRGELYTTSDGGDHWSLVRL